MALETRPSVALPVRKEETSYRYAIRLPKGVVFTGPSEDQEAFLGEGENRVRLRLRYISGGNRSPLEGTLPFLASEMRSRKRRSNCRQEPLRRWWN